MRIKDFIRVWPFKRTEVKEPNITEILQSYAFPLNAFHASLVLLLLFIGLLWTIKGYFKHDARKKCKTISVGTETERKMEKKVPENESTRDKSILEKGDAVTSRDLNTPVATKGTETERKKEKKQPENESTRGKSIREKGDAVTSSEQKTPVATKGTETETKKEKKVPENESTRGKSIREQKTPVTTKGSRVRGRSAGRPKGSQKKGHKASSSKDRTAHALDLEDNQRSKSRAHRKKT